MQPTQEQEESLQRILAGQNVTAILPSLSPNPKIRVSWPDLSGFQRHAWGDWGPCYEIITEGKADISFQYEAGQAGSMIKHTCSPTTVKIKSPMFVAEREQTPWYLDLVDKEINLCVRCVFDKAGFVSETKAYQHEPQTLKVA